MDGRFWSGAAVAIMVVIAGATSLPALLLRAPAELPMPVVKASQPAALQPLVPAQPVTQAEPTVATVAPAPPPPAPGAATAVTPAATPTSAPSPVAAADAFPPVQPPTIEEAPQAPAAAVISKPARAQRPHEKAAVQEGREHKRQRPVRPAIYPMREFLAWRR